MSSTARDETDADRSLLVIAENLARYHREHEKFYADAPLQTAMRLQRVSRGLKALAERWRTSGPEPNPLPVPFAGAPDLNDDRAIEGLGLLFMEGEGEPAELASIKAELRALAESHRSIGTWLTSTMDASWGIAQRLLDHPGLADLLAERHRIITTDWQVASLSSILGHAVDRAVDILDRIDFAPAALRQDLGGDHRDSRLLFSACELLDHAAGLAATSATLTQENDRRWRVFHDRVHEMTRSSSGA